MKFDIVVAHYKENLRWISKLDHPSIRRVFVYTKGPFVGDMSNERTTHIYLPNVGRESHTYLWHCSTNFDAISSKSMSDFTFFIQGSPHSMKPQRIKDWIQDIEKYSLPFTLNYRISNPYDFLAAGRCPSWAGNTESSKIDVGQWCNKFVVEMNAFDNTPIFWNACFGVSSNCIAKSCKEKITTILQDELSSINPECGHYCERLWYYILGMNKHPVINLPEGYWHFFGGPKKTRHYGILKLSDDGSVMFYDHENEKRWSRKGNKINLIGSNGLVTSSLEEISDDEYYGSTNSTPKSLHILLKSFLH